MNLSKDLKNQVITQQPYMYYIYKIFIGKILEKQKIIFLNKYGYINKNNNIGP